MIFKDDASRARIEAWVQRFADRLPPHEVRTVDTASGPTRVRVLGEGPPVVAFHGALASWAHLAHELQGLARERTLFAVDVIGQSVHGPPVRPSPRGPAYGDWALEVVDGLELERPDLLGVSWGGFVATALVRRAPTRIRRLALMVPAGFATGALWEGMLAGWRLWRYTRAPSPERLDALLQILASEPEDALWRAYLGEALTAYTLDFSLPARFTAAELQAYEGPVWMWAAERDVQFDGRRALARARQVFGDRLVETRLIEGRHMPPTTDAFREELAGSLGAFFAAGLPVHGS